MRNENDAIVSNATTNHIRNQFLTSLKSETKPITDKTFLTILLILAVPAWLFCMSYSSIGNPEKLLHGVNFNGRYCGMADTNYDLTEYPYVYWPFNPTTNKLAADTPICVKSCPTQKNVEAGETTQYPIKSIVSATDGSDMTTFTIHRLSVPVYPTFLVNDMFCVPDKDELRDEIGNNIATVGRQFTFAIGSIYNARWIIGFILVVTIGLCVLVNRLLLQGFNGIEWIFFGISILSLTGSGIALITHGVSDLILSTFLAFQKINDILCITIGALLIVGSFLFFVRTTMQTEKIKTGMELIFKANDVISDNLSLTFGPIFFAFMQVGFFVYWINIAASIISNGSALPVSTTSLSNSVQGSAVVYGTRNILSIDCGAIVAFSLWVLLGIFISVCIAEIASYATSWVTSVWYWTDENTETEIRDIKVSFAFTRSALILLTKHFGSVALKSILSIVLCVPNALFASLGRVSERDGSGSINGLTFIANIYRKYIEWLTDSAAWVEFARQATPTGIVQTSKEAYTLKISSQRSIAKFYDAASLVGRMGEIFVCSFVVMAFVGLVNQDLFIRGTNVAVISPISVCIVLFAFSYALASILVRTPATIAETEVYCFIFEARKNYHLINEAVYCPAHLKPHMKEANIVDDDMLVELASLDDKGYMNLANVGQSFFSA